MFDLDEVKEAWEPHGEVMDYRPHVDGKHHIIIAQDSGEPEAPDYHSDHANRIQEAWDAEELWVVEVYDDDGELVTALWDIIADTPSQALDYYLDNYELLGEETVEDFEFD